MADSNQEDMQDLSVRELKTDMDGRFRELKTELDGRFAEVGGRFADVDRRFAEVDRRFDRLEARMGEEHVETRRHFDVVAEQLRTEMKLIVEGCYARLDNHERRIQTLEKRRR
jgi:hypothetical protein